MSEAYVWHELVLRHDRFDVSEYLVARRVVRGPICLFFEGVLILYEWVSTSSLVMETMDGLTQWDGMSHDKPLEARCKSKG